VIKHIELFEEMAATLAASLVKRGVASSAARSVAEEVIEAVHRNFAGQNIYIPSGLGYQVARRNAEIRRRLAAGERREALCREFHISETRVRQIEAEDTAPARGPITHRKRTG
jgi:Mor family transcriptional regulator